MFAVKPRIEIAFRILLIAAILFNAFATNITVAQAEQESVSTIDSSSDSKEPDIHSIPAFERPKPRIGEIKTSSLEQSTTETLPIAFIENVGQFNNNEIFQAQTSSGTIHLTKNSIWITLIDDQQPSTSKEKGSSNNTSNILTPTPESSSSTTDSEKTNGVHIRLSFENSNINPQMVGYDPQDAHISYFVGNSPANWRSDVPVWGGIKYKEIYPGIDLVITSESGKWVWYFEAAGDAQKVSEN